MDECKTSKTKTDLDAFLLVRALGLEVGLVLVGSLHAQEAVGGVADAAGQHAVPQHGVHHGALAIAGPGRGKNTQLSIHLTAGTGTCSVHYTYTHGHAHTHKSKNAHTQEKLKLSFGYDPTTSTLRWVRLNV